MPSLLPFFLLQGLELSQIGMNLTSPLPMMMTVETVPQSSDERSLLHVLAVDPAVCSGLTGSVCRTFSNVTLSSVRSPAFVHTLTACIIVIIIIIIGPVPDRGCLQHAQYNIIQIMDQSSCEVMSLATVI